MKRSALARKTPLRSSKPMKRKAKRKKSTDKRWRSESYLRWIRRQPCCACATLGCDAHHVIALPWNISGMGLTAPDNFACSLCRTCHTLTHATPELQQMQPDWLRHTLTSGIEEFSGEVRKKLIEALTFVEEKERQRCYNK